MPDNAPVKLVRVLEVEPEPEGFKPTGREIQIEQDCPLFRMPGWEQALEHGVVMVDKPMFLQLIAVIEDADRGS